MSLEPLHFEASLESSLSPEDLWPLVADTQRLNRSIGLPVAHFEFTPREDGGSVPTGTYRQLGFTISRWREHPFEFVKPYQYSVLREYEVGPFTRVHGGTQLIPREGRTTVRVWADITPRHVLGVLAARLLVGPQSTSRVLTRCRRYESELLKQRGGATGAEAPSVQAQMAVFAGPAPDVKDERRLEQLTAELVRVGGDPEISGLLKAHLAKAPDDRVSSMRAFELADLWGQDRRATLASFLRATTVGLLEMRWDVLCPVCRVPKESVGTLAEMTGQAHCESCAVTFDASFDRLVEVRFRPATAIRDAVEGVFCIGGPQNTPHVIAQTELPAGESRTWELRLPAGQYRLRSPQSGASLIEVGERPGDQASAVAVEPLRMVPPLLRLAGEQVALEIESHLEAPAVVALEEQSWADTAATAALVSTMAEFRDLFSSEVLAPGLQVAIQRLALLFTDLSGSTAMYERIGQARAFRLVQDHFRVLDPAIRGHNGSMVKTIGDAVMAVFPSTKDAVGCALQMQCGIRELGAAEGVDPTHLLKVGIHSGACLAVTLNDKLDYFGTAVNIAARTEHECYGGEIMITAEGWGEEGVEELLTAAAERVEPTKAMLRGITEPVRLFRIIGVKCPD
ncbi:MAG: adenylate/guanylate cyclase domain-containing protein [Chloroflexi bacterium]|nr:adenylate/guanylate cyclase domain-containing protein [Chloroflexota bacterium]